MTGLDQTINSNIAKPEKIMPKDNVFDYGVIGDTEQGSPEKELHVEDNPIEIPDSIDPIAQYTEPKLPDSPPMKTIHESPEEIKKSNEKQLIKTTKKLIENMMMTQKELEDQKNSPSPDQDNRGSRQNMFDILEALSPIKPGDVSKLDISSSHKEQIRKSLTGHDEHVVPFKRKQAENEAGADLKNPKDTKFEMRHTKQYEDEVEMEHVSKFMPKETVEKLRTSLVTKMQRMNRKRSNSDDKIMPQQLKVKKLASKLDRRHSINKKIEPTNSENLMVNTFLLEGTIIPSFDESESSENANGMVEMRPSDTKETGDMDVTPDSPAKNDDFNRDSLAAPIGIDDFSPKDDIEGVEKLATFDKVEDESDYIDHDDTEEDINIDEELNKTQIINNEKRNLGKETALEPPQRSSKINEYKQHLTEESKVQPAPEIESKVENAKLEVSLLGLNN